MHLYSMYFDFLYFLKNDSYHCDSPNGRIAIKVVYFRVVLPVMSLSLSLFKPVHLAQSCFQVETFGHTFTLDLELNQ